jgi:hypothetical protein
LCSRGGQLGFGDYMAGWTEVRSKIDRHHCTGNSVKSQTVVIVDDALKGRSRTYTDIQYLSQHDQESNKFPIYGRSTGLFRNYLLSAMTFKVFANGYASNTVDNSSLTS